MSLKDFMQQLQEQDDDVIYSKPPEESIQIIPPSKVDKAKNLDAIKIIPPKEETPKVIKFKLNLNSTVEETKSEVVNKQPEVIIPPSRKTPEIIIPNKQVENKRPINQTTNTQRQQQTQSKVYNENVNKKEPIKNSSPPPINTPVKKPDKGEELFIRSETPLSKKEIWFEYYNKALKSNKTNFVTDKCRRGRFMINEENKFIVLSDYDTYDKDANEILRDSWF